MCSALSSDKLPAKEKKNPIIHQLSITLLVMQFYLHVFSLFKYVLVFVAFLDLEHV